MPMNETDPKTQVALPIRAEAGLWSTIGDYSNFWSWRWSKHGALGGNRILSPETVAFMTQNHPLIQPSLQIKMKITL